MKLGKIVCFVIIILTAAFFMACEEEDTNTAKDGQLPEGFEFGFILVNDMQIYRAGSSEAERTIDFDVYDSKFEIVTHAGVRALVKLEVIDGGGLTIELKEGKLVIKEDKTLNPDDYIAEINVKYNGKEQDPAFITVTVDKLVFDVKFYNSETEISEFALIVEYGDTAAAPAIPALPGFVFDGKWYTDAALTADFNFDTVITGETILYGGYTAVTDNWTLKFIITLEGASAALQPNESIYFQLQTGTWAIFSSELQGNGTYTGSTENIPIATTGIDYRIFAVPPGGVSETITVGYAAWSGVRRYNYNTALAPDAQVVNITVTEWLRPQIAAEELLKKTLMRTSGWDTASLMPEWKFESLTGGDYGALATSSNSGWLTGDGASHLSPGILAPNTMYYRAYHRESGTNHLAENETGKISQDVPATGTIAGSGYVLQNGVPVTLIVRAARPQATVSSVKLHIGGQEYSVDINSLPTTNNGQWRKITFSTMLTQADIISDGTDFVNVGISFTRTGTGENRFSVDSFSFTIGNGTTGVTAP